MKQSVLFLALLLTASVFAQSSNPAYAEDVQSIDAIITAYYEVVSGSSSAPWQFERDQYLHSKNAVITRFDTEGQADTHTLEAEYIPLALMPKSDLYEKELKRKVSRYGRMAQVWSAFEIRTDPQVPTDIHGLNSIQLLYENDRWYIASWTCEMESEDNPIVANFLGEE
ncbi:hypothetical protein [Croceiramulus getboli]|nr:hypothetical protein P8624_09220 [Flavobacteriaceae bacterium YJPT1-3]